MMSRIRTLEGKHPGLCIIEVAIVCHSLYNSGCQFRHVGVSKGLDLCLIKWGSSRLPFTVILTLAIHHEEDFDCYGSVNRLSQASLK